LPTWVSFRRWNIPPFYDEKYVNSYQFFSLGTGFGYRIKNYHYQERWKFEFGIGLALSMVDTNPYNHKKLFELSLVPKK